MQLGALRRIVHVDPETTAQRLALLEEAAREALEQVRTAARQLRPSALDQVGLEEAVRQVADSLGVTLEWQGALPDQLPAAVEVAAYRIATEALTNVARHAQADSAVLEVAVEDGVLRLSVSDYGVGFPAGSPVGVGLPAMRERVEELGGSFAVRSAAGDGTRVTATLPCGQRAGAPTVVAS